MRNISSIKRGDHVRRGSALEVFVLWVKEDGGINFKKVGAVGAFFCRTDDCYMAVVTIKVMPYDSAFELSGAGVFAVLGKIGIVRQGDGFFAEDPFTIPGVNELGFHPTWLVVVVEFSNGDLDIDHRRNGVFMV